MPALKVAAELRDGVHKATGLTCSAGVGPNRLLAKVCVGYGSLFLGWLASPIPLADLSKNRSRLVWAFFFLQYFHFFERYIFCFCRCVLILRSRTGSTFWTTTARLSWPSFPHNPSERSTPSLQAVTGNLKSARSVLLHILFWCKLGIVFSLSDASGASYCLLTAALAQLAGIRNRESHRGVAEGSAGSKHLRRLTDKTGLHFCPLFTNIYRYMHHTCLFVCVFLNTVIIMMWGQVRLSVGKRVLLHSHALT